MRRLLASLLAFLILSPIVLIIFRPQQVAAAWFDDNYSYRQKFSFTHNADITTDRLITITIDTASLITAGVMRSDCADTRFTDINGKVLRYQLTGTCNNASTTYDLVFPSIVNGTNTGYVYYGNPTAVSKSDPAVNQVTALTPSGGAPSLTNRSAEEKGQTPVLSWNLSEGYGATANDSSQFTNNGTLTNSPAWQNKDLCLFNGNCLQFDGSNDNVQKTYSSDKELDVGTASMSASLWYKHPGSIAATQYLISRYTTTSPFGGYKVYMKSTGVVCFGIDDDTAWNPDDEACDSNSTADSKWHFLEAVKSEGTQSITIYVDGKQVGQKTSLSATGSISGNSPTFYVGIDSNGSSSPWSGFISRVKIYNFARTASQIQSDFANIGSVDQVSVAIGSADSSSSLNQGLVGYWKMDDGVGNPCSAGVDKACDSSGNANTGTWTNGVASTSGKFGFATNYDGVNDFTSVANTVSSVQSVSFWAKPATSSASLMQLATGIDIKATTGTVATDGISTPTIYVNGIVNGTFTANVYNHVVVTTETAISASSIQFGKMQTGVLNGQLDDVRIYNRALSPSEVSRLYDWSPGPVGWWKLEERAGATANDSSGNANTGTLTNGPQWTSGKVGSALSFDGVDDYVQSANNIPITGSAERSVSVWFNASDFTNNSILLWGTYCYNNENFLYISNSKLAFTSCDAATVTGNTTLSTNTWYHYVFTYDSSNSVKLYLNGILDVTSTITALDTGVSNLTVGQQMNGSVSYFKGLIDDVRVYNYALTPKQIISIMNAGHPAVGSPVGSAVGYWKLDDGFGQTASNSGAAQTALDATLLGAVPPSWRNSGKFGKALNFSGSSAYAKVGNDTSAQITGDLTLSSWVYLSSTSTNQDIIAKRGPPGQWAYRLWIDDTSTPKIDIVGPQNAMATASASTTLSANQWYHLTGTYSASQSAVTIYINGLQKGQTTSGIPNSIKNSTGDLDIGAENFGNTNKLNGSLDEIKLYNYALSPDEVKLEYNHGSSIVLGSFSTGPDGVSASNSASSIYCPPGNAEGNCATELDPSPVGEWKLDERKGTTAYDTSGNANNGTITAGSGGWIAGKVGSAYNFDRTTTIINAGSGSSLDNLPTAGMTLEAWIYFKQSGFIMAKNVGNSVNNGWFLRINNGDDSTFSVDGSTDLVRVTNTSSVTRNAWNHLVLSWDGVITTASSVHIYINGVEASYATTTNGANRVDDATSSFFIGNDSTQSRTFGGYIDDVRIYNYARTASQVAWDYNRGGPVGWWKLDECTGTTAHDSSGNANNGTITIGTSGSQNRAGTCTDPIANNLNDAWFNGGSATQSGKFNSSLNFDGTDDYASTSAMPSGTVMIASGSAVSWGGWFNPTTGVASKTLIEKNREFRLTTDSSSQPNCSIWTAGAWSTAAISSTALSLNSWQHLLCTYDGTNIKAYLNAVQVGTTAQTASITSLSYTPLTTGHNFGGAAYYSGRVDDVRLYTYPLTPAQIRTLYNQDSAVRFGPLTGSP